MASTPSTLRQRGVGSKARSPTKESSGKNVHNDALDILAKGNTPNAPSQWDYKLALAVITVMAFATRFYGISHPNEVVFDEVHFGKVSGNCPFVPSACYGRLRDVLRSKS
jgi:dolichyl-phosphate-mannose-protein mannosyltransferase